MRQLRTLVLIIYLFVAILVWVLAHYHILHALLDGEMSYVKNIPLSEKAIDGWKLRYFIPHAVTILISFALLFIGYMYHKKGETSTVWRTIFQFGFMVVIVIATLIIYSIATQPIDPIIP